MRAVRAAVCGSRWVISKRITSYVLRPRAALFLWRGRSRALIESEDFVTWSEPRLIFTTDDIGRAVL
jgi:hypothetical protein